MAITTTGSLLGTLNDGVAKGLESPTGKVILIVAGTPSAKLQTTVPSGIAFDATNGQYYMAKTGSSWIKLGSVQ